MIRNFLVAGILTTSLLNASAALAQVSGDQLKAGQTIFFSYYGDITEGKVLSVEGSQVKIEAPNPLTHQFDGSNIRHVDLARVMLSKPGTGGGAGGGGGGMPANTPAASAGNTQPGGVGQHIVHTAQQQQSKPDGGTPRMGRYHMYGFPSMSSPMQLVGWFDLMAGGTYKTQAGGTGTYRFGGDGIQWLSGPYKEQGFLGIVRIDRGGLTSRITLTKTAGGNDRMVAFCSADK